MRVIGAAVSKIGFAADVADDDNAVVWRAPRWGKTQQPREKWADLREKGEPVRNIKDG